MKTVIKTAIFLSFFITASLGAQQSSTMYRPALSKNRVYNALYVINDSDDLKIRSVLININGALEDKRLKGKLHVELLAFGAGVEMFKKVNPYEPILRKLIDKGVVMVECENTMVAKHIAKAELFDFVNYTPSANGEIILRQYEGWAVVKP